MPISGPGNWPPGADSTRVWAWQGPRHAVLAAGGDPAGFEGGAAHALGPEVSRDPDWHVGVPLHRARMTASVAAAE